VRDGFARLPAQSLGRVGFGPFDSLLKLRGIGSPTTSLAVAFPHAAEGTAATPTRATSLSAGVAPEPASSAVEGRKDAALAVRLVLQAYLAVVRESAANEGEDERAS
jgi:hypothetical protein